MSILWNVIRGGQTRLHNVRMFLQITKRIGIFSLLFYVIFVIGFFFTKTTTTQRNFAWQWSCSQFSVWCKFNQDGQTGFTYYKNNRPVKAVSTHRKIINNRLLANNFYQIKSTFINGLKWGIGFVLFFVFIICRYLYSTGFKASKDKLISGSRIINISGLKKLLRQNIRKEGNSGINLAGVQLSKTMDTTHTFIVGASGSGKTVLCRALLTSIRLQKKRAIIYDVSGEFTKNFYHPDKDIILNPLDKRTARWDLWLDCKRSEHFHSLAEALIPIEVRGSEDFFIKAARTVLANIAERMSHGVNPLLENLLELLLTADFSTLIEQVKGTEAAALLNKEGGRTAASVRAVIAANIKSMSYLQTVGQSFSIRDWVREETHPSGFIFITSNDEQLPLLKPLITLWVNIATNAILSLEPARNRRIYLLIDELSSLNRVPALHPFLAQGRKYGGGAILCTQGYSQMVDSLGDKETKALAGGCSNVSDKPVPY